jgi:hypothetical protein
MHLAYIKMHLAYIKIHLAYIIIHFAYVKMHPFDTPYLTTVDYPEINANETGHSRNNLTVT